MPSKPLNTLQAGRGLAACAVLLFHTTTTLELPKYLGHFVFPVFRAGNSGVQFFFVLSGFVIFLAHRKDAGRPAALGEFFRKRFTRIYPPLWAVLLMIVPVYFLFPSLGKGGERSLSTIAGAFLITPAPQEFLLATEWTLRHEILFYCIFGLLIWRRSAGLVVASVWLALSATLPWLGWNYPWDFFFSTNHLLFGFGVLACFAVSRAVGTEALASLSVAAGVLLFAASWFEACRSPDPSANLLNLTYGAGAALTIYGLAVLERAGRITVPRTFVFLGEASYSIYLVQYFFVSVFTKLLVAADRNGFHIPDPLIFAAIASGALAAGIVFHLIVEKPLLKQVATLTRKERPFPATAR